ncbi:MAG: B12-binding domain-containing radical SAM protein [Fibrobacteres bacterium]|nr:B12-binding domain-containing radical SAM protein [Fibrobacterota bacterium]
MEPLPAAYLAALAAPYADISFHDDRMEAIPYDEPADLVAISVETYTAKRAYQIATEYRKRGVPVVMGGFHATLIPEEVMEYAEAIVIGEGEQLFPRLLEDFRAGRMKRVYRAEGRSEIGSIRPDRSIFAGKRYLKIGLVEAARGCHFKCDFCAITTYFGATQSRRPIDNVIAEIRSIKDGRKLFFFVDDNIVSHPKWAKEFYRALIPLKIRWVSQATLTMAQDNELMDLMKRSGCQGVLIGFETLDPANLKAMNKRFNEVKGGFPAVISKLNRHGLRLYATFIFGYDADTPESFARTVAFCKEQNIFMVAFNHITPFPGTQLYKRLEKEGRLLYGKWWLDDRYQYGQVPFKTVLPPELIQEECVKARKSFYSLGSILKRLRNRANTGSLFMLRSYFFINFLLGKEASQRENYPLGDASWRGTILKADEDSLRRAGVIPEIPAMQAAE